MPLISGLVPAAAISAILAGVCAIVLARAARAVGGDARRACLMLAVALPVGALGLVAAAVDAVVARDAPGLRLAAEIGVGSTLSALLIVAAVLVLPAVAGGGRALLRNALDGLVIAASVFYAGWTLLIEPLHRRYVGGPVPLRLEADCLVVAGPSLAAILAVSVLAAAALKSRPGRRACLVAAAPCAIGAALPAAASFQAGPVMLAAGVAYALAGAGLAYVVLATPQPPQWDADQPHDGLAVSLGLVGVAVAAYVFRVLFVDDSIDQVSIASAAVIGGALAAQQALARLDLRRTTERLMNSEAHFRVMAYTDALTGLANRRQLLAALQEAVDGPPCVLLAIDLDGFKNINDTRGHDVGDAVLVEVAQRLRANVRPGDLAVRMGGDEFAVLMRAPPTEATAAADRLLSVLCRPYERDVGSAFLSASIGLAACASADSIEGLMRNADVALRFAKQRGKQRVEQYDLAYDQWLRRRTDLEHELRGAVERGELMLVYQPVVHLPDGRVTGVEALLRWHHPTLGQVPPDEFIPLAEEAGLIGGLGSFVLHEACHQLARWIADGHEINMSVNVSVRELHTPEYAVQVAEMLRRHRVPAQRLVIEVTEHAVALDVEQLVDRLTALRAAGVRVALDDFGSGYSSLGQLRTLPVDILKIDRALIATPGSAAVRFAPPLADVVVQLGNRLGLDVVAEGITDEAQRRVVEEAGCRYAQGDLFGRPMPAERVEVLFGARPGPPRQRAADDAKVQNLGSVDSGHEMRQS